MMRSVLHMTFQKAIAKQVKAEGHKARIEGVLKGKQVDVLV